MVESNELIKKNFNIERDSILLEEQKKIFNKIVEERTSKFKNFEKRINHVNLTYNCKTEEASLKNYQNLMQLFKK